jgi:hypothetical protein
VSQSHDETWIAQSAKENSWWIHQRLAPHLVGPADVAAWEKGGSPTTYQIVAQKGVTGQRLKLTLPSTAGTTYGDQTNGDAGQVFAIGDKSVTVADIQALPTEVAALRTLLVSATYKDPTTRTARCRATTTSGCSPSPAA